MKILQVNCVYNEESTGKIVADIHNHLKREGISSIVCFGRGLSKSEENVYRLCSNVYAKLCKAIKVLVGPMYGGCFLSTKKLIRIINRKKPDIVHLHCINGDIVNIYRIITYLRDKKIKTLLTLHAEFIYTANCGYSLDCDKWLTGCGKCPRLRKETGELLFDWTHYSWKMMKKSFEGFNDNIIISSVSPWLESRAKQSPILMGKRHCVVLNGINTEQLFHYTSNNRRQALGLDNKKIILYITASFNRPIKGGKYALEIARRLPEYVLVIIGNEDPIDNAPSNTVILGRIDDQKVLAEYYSMADLLLLTSEKETFCMPVAESLCCGTPVVGFKAGAPEQIAIKEYSCFVEFGDIDLLEKRVVEYANMSWNKEEISQKAIDKYSSKRMSVEYVNLYKELLDED